MTTRPQQLSGRWRVTRVVGALALAVATSLLSATVHAPPAGAAEVYPRPQSGQVTLAGHGFGHGMGLSSWGAYGVARQGVRWQDILGHYYRGASQTPFGNPTVRVDVRGDMGSQMAFPATSGLWATFGSAHANPTPIGTTGADGRPIVVFQAVAVSPSALQLVYLSQSGYWLRWGPPTTQLNVTNRATGEVTAWGVGGRIAGYAGEYRAVMVSGAVVPVAALPLDQYVRGVLPREVIASWPAAALSAQGVASRTFAAYALSHPRSWAYDLCDTTACQVYKGSGFHPATDAAVAATSGIVLTYGGRAIVAYYSASSGGWSASGGQPYLPAQPDPWDTPAVDPYRNWTASVPVSKIESTWPSIGSFTQLRVLARDGAGEWGGRVTSAALDGTAGSVTVSGFDLRVRLGLRSTYFIPTG